MTVKKQSGGQKAKPAVKNKRRRSWRSWGLHEPFAADEILEEHDTPTPFKYNCEIPPRNKFSPPFIIDSPGLEDGLDDRRRFLLTVRPPQLLLDRRRLTVRIQFHRYRAGFVYGS
jgi:hypothetical protein